MAEHPIRTFAEFWPFYLSQHANPTNRLIHVAGTCVGVAAAAYAAATGTWWLLAVSPVFGYGPAWIGHFFVEHNRPATFTYPLWSLAGDFKMAALTLIGRLKLSETGG